MEGRKTAAVSSVPGVARSDAGAYEPALDALIEILATWSAGEGPGGAEILRTLAAFGAPERLRSIHSQASALLSETLASEIAEAVEILGAGDSSRAPSFRARLDNLLARAADELGAGVELERAEAAGDLNRWAAALEWDVATRLIEALWRAEPGDDAEANVAALESLSSLRRDLSAARDALRGKLEKSIASLSTSAPRVSDTLEAASAALREDDPVAMARMAAILSRLDSESSRLQSDEDLANARLRLRALHEEAQRQLTDAGTSLEPAPERLLKEALAQIDEALQASAASHSGWPVALVRWEETLRGFLDGATDSAAAAQARRQKVAESLTLDLQGVELSAGEEAATLIRCVTRGGAAWVEAVTSAAGAVARREKDVAASIAGAAATLRSASEQMSTVLERASSHLPAARVVQARLWIEQAEGLIAEGDVNGITTMAAALTEESRSLKALGELIAKRRQSREESDRDVARREIARLKNVAPERQGAALAALEKQVKEASAAALPGLRERIKSLEGALESAVRYEAGMLLHQAGRLKGASAASTANASEAARAALVKEDLATTQAATADLRRAVRAAAPLTRPGFRMALAAVAAALILSSGVAVKFYFSRPTSCRLVLGGNRTKSIELQLVRNDEVYISADYEKDNKEGITLRLPDGRYEIYVGKKYSGVAFQIPGTREIKNIPSLE